MSIYNIGLFKSLIRKPTANHLLWKVSIGDDCMNEEFFVLCWVTVESSLIGPIFRPIPPFILPTGPSGPTAIGCWPFTNILDNPGFDEPPVVNDLVPEWN